MKQHQGIGIVDERRGRWRETRGISGDVADAGFTDVTPPFGCQGHTVRIAKSYSTAHAAIKALSQRACLFRNAIDPEIPGVATACDGHMGPGIVSDVAGADQGVSGVGHIAYIELPFGAGRVVAWIDAPVIGAKATSIVIGE